MHRLLVDSDALRSDRPLLPLGASRHLRVLRPKDGERIELFNGAGSWRVFVYEAKSCSVVACAGEDIRFAPRSARNPIMLLACVTKGSRWDWTIEKATELGVTRIIPVLSARTVVRIENADRAAKAARWRRVAEDAARQSDAKWLPEIAEPVDFDASCEYVRKTRCFVGALTVPRPEPVLRAVQGAVIAPDDVVSVYVGPEGDFTPDELSTLLTLATPVSFGDTVLRAETAAIYGVCALKTALLA